MAAPLWSRVLTKISLNAHRAYRLQEVLRDELLFAYLPASARNELTIAAYDSTPAYAFESYVARRGLFAWEQAILREPLVPASGRVVLAAAGGGRELVALAERGYEVFAFEPSLFLLQAAERVARAYTGVSVRRASYADLVARARGRAGALDGVDLSASLVWFGWGSFTHLTDPREQLEVLRAARELWPDAPVVVSFFLRKEHQVDDGSPSVRMRRALRLVLGKLNGAKPPEGLEYQTHEGFSYSFGREEIERLFAGAGYQAALFKDEPFPHALLVPRAA